MQTSYDKWEKEDLEECKDQENLQNSWKLVLSGQSLEASSEPLKSAFDLSTFHLVNCTN